MTLYGICENCFLRIHPACVVPSSTIRTFVTLAGLILQLSSVCAEPTGGGGGGAQTQMVPLSEENAPLEITAGAFAYLRNYGYIGRDDPQASTIRRIEDYHSAIRSFQHFYGLPETGQLDAETNRLMSYPRCGVADVFPDGNPGQTRFRRFSDSGDKWDHPDVTYRILNFTPDLSEAEVVDAFERAFKVWSDVTPLTFRRVYDATADIHIQFSEYAHGDGVAFDGLGGTLAHAYFPGAGIGGDAHFDDSEIFSVFLSDDEKTDLFMVAAHEFGHSLGLGHSSEINALMAPFYVAYDPEFSLSYDDLHGIQSIYGINSNPSPGDRYVPARPPPSPPDPDVERCSKSFNAIAFIRSELFLFKGKNFWRMRERGKPLEGYPVEIAQFWHGLPPKVDAAYERHDGKIVFLKASHYWVYEGVDMEPGYPRSLHELGLPADVDGALPWGRTGKTYFFKDDVYWRFDEFDKRMDKGYPKQIKDNWFGVPNNIDAVFRHYDGYSWNTFFIRHRRYWQFDESQGQVDLGFPQNFGVDWMGCKADEEVKVDVQEGPGQLRVAVTLYPTMTAGSGSHVTTSSSNKCILISLLVALLLNALIEPVSQPVAIIIK